MKDGTVLEGDVITDFLNYTVVDFKMKDGTKKILSGMDIVKIFQDDEFRIRRIISMKDGTVLEGYIIYEGWFRYIIRKDLQFNSEIEVAKTDIRSITPPRIKVEIRKDIIAKKKEGWYFTGFPVVAFSSDNGFRGGAKGYLFYNGSRDEKYFNTTPYKLQLYAQFTASTGGLITSVLSLDWRNVGGSSLRIKAAAEYEWSTNANYYGTGNKTTTTPLTDAYGRTYQTFADYQRAFLYGNFSKYNKYEYQMPKFAIDFIGDWSFPIKPLLGYQFKWSEIKPWDGRDFKINEANYKAEPTSLLTRENPVGINGGITSFLRAGIALDTRDYPPDPHEGFYIDYAFEGSAGFLGSQYDYIRNSIGARFYTTWFDTLTLAVRFGYVASLYDIPFYEMGIFGFLFERQEGLGGEKTIRGFQQWRFIGKGMTLANIELRYRIIDLLLFNQRFTFKLLAFVDAGNAYSEAAEAFTNPRFLDYKLAYGVGFIYTWNQATVIRMYAGFSAEDFNISFNFGHAL